MSPLVFQNGRDKTYQVLNSKPLKDLIRYALIAGCSSEYLLLYFNKWQLFWLFTFINIFKGNFFMRLEKKKTKSEPSATHPTGVFLFGKNYVLQRSSKICKLAGIKLSLLLISMFATWLILYPYKWTCVLVCASALVKEIP